MKSKDTQLLEEAYDSVPKSSPSSFPTNDSGAEHNLQLSSAEAQHLKDLLNDWLEGNQNSDSEEQSEQWNVVMSVLKKIE